MQNTHNQKVSAAAATPEPPQAKAQHSPLPWKHHDDTRGSVYASDGFSVADCYGQFRDAAEIIDNADFIAEACTNYERVKAERDELLAALKERDREHSDRRQTAWGTKTKLGLLRTVKAAINQPFSDDAMSVREISYDTWGIDGGGQ